MFTEPWGGNRDKNGYTQGQREKSPVMETKLKEKNKKRI